MSEVSILIELPGRRMEFTQDAMIIESDPEIIQAGAVRLLESVYADARAALSVEWVTDDGGSDDSDP